MTQVKKVLTVLKDQQEPKVIKVNEVILDQKGKESLFVSLCNKDSFLDHKV